MMYVKGFIQQNAVKKYISKNMYPDIIDFNHTDQP